jgi:hypothetical protein
MNTKKYTEIYNMEQDFYMRKRGIKYIQETLETGIGHKEVENRRYMLNHLIIIFASFIVS